MINKLKGQSCKGIKYSHQNTIDILKNQEEGRHKEMESGSQINEDDNTNTDPTKVTEVEIDYSMEDLNVQIQDITEAIIVKNIVNRASSLN